MFRFRNPLRRTLPKLSQQRRESKVLQKSSFHTVHTSLYRKAEVVRLPKSVIDGMREKLALSHVMHISRLLNIGNINMFMTYQLLGELANVAF